MTPTDPETDLTKLRLLLSIATIAVLATVFAACGGGDDSGAADLEPAEVLEQAFSGDHELNSGILGASVSVEVSGEQGGAGSLSINAPFNNNGTDEVPDADIEIELDAEGAGQSIEFAGGAAVTPEGAAVNFNDTDYEVPAEVFDEFAKGLTDATEQGSSQDLKVDPINWFTNLVNEGTEDVDGGEAVKVTGQADVTKMIEDLLRAAQDAGLPADLPQGFDPSQLSLLEGFIEDASFEVLADTETFLLRRLEVRISLQNLAAVSGSDTDTASFELVVSVDEPNEEQSIELPEDTESFDQLEADLEREFGDLLGASGADLGDLPGAGGAGGSGGSSGAAGSSEDVPGVSQEFLDCQAGAETPEELAKCAEEL